MFEPLLGNVSPTFKTIWKYFILKTEPTGHVNHGSTFLCQVIAFLSHSGYIGYALIFRLLLAMKVSEQSHAGIMNNGYISSIVKASTKVSKF